MAFRVQHAEGDTRSGSRVGDRGSVDDLRRQRPHAPVRDGKFRAEVAGGVELQCPGCGDRIHRENLTIELPLADGGSLDLFVVNCDEPLEEVVADVKRKLAARALARTAGNKKRAAELVGMKYTTFYSMLQRLGLGD